MSKAETFKARANRLFVTGNPGASISRWTLEPQSVTYPTGLTGTGGRFIGTGPGYRTTELMVTESNGEMMIR
jgi:hypothetical protein